jgi:hypothetical protein
MHSRATAALSLDRRQLGLLLPQAFKLLAKIIHLTKNLRNL